MSSAAYATIKQALLDKKQIAVIYQNHRRNLCPHVIGWKADKDGAEREKVLVYQFGGSSSKPLAQPGSSKNWRCLFIDELTGLVVNEGPWHTATDHWSTTGQQECIDRIDVQVPR